MNWVEADFVVTAVRFQFAGLLGVRVAERELVKGTLRFVV